MKTYTTTEKIEMITNSNLTRYEKLQRLFALARMTEPMSDDNREVAFAIVNLDK